MPVFLDGLAEGRHGRKRRDGLDRTAWQDTFAADFNHFFRVNESSVDLFQTSLPLSTALRVMVLPRSLG